MSARTAPDRNIAMELVRVTEAGAMAAARWIGRGAKESADQAAVDAMRYVLDSVEMRGVVVIGEGEKDEAPMLYNGEEVGNGHGPEVDVAVDPLEGTRLTALGQPGAIAVMAVAERGTMLFPGAALYMEKIAVGPRRDRRDRHHEEPDRERPCASPRRSARRRARSTSSCSSATGTTALIAELREAGRARAADPRRRRGARDRRGAARNERRRALRHRRHARGRDLRGGAQVRRRRHPGPAVAPQRRGARPPARGGLDPARVLHTNDLVSGEDVFVAATGVTTGSLLRGVQYYAGGAITDSIVMRSRSGTVRRVVAQQSLSKLSALTGFEYT